MALFSRKSSLEKSYDSVAEEYVLRTQDELLSKPTVKAVVDNFAAAIADSGPCCDIGCGPGHITHYLQQQGVDVCGLDQSGRMLKQARKLYPDIKFHRGDLREMKFADHQFSSLVAFYALSHIAPEELTPVLLELRRILEPGGALLLAFYSGNFSEQVHHWWGQQVELTFHCHRTLDMIVELQQSGFERVSTYIRPAVADETFQARQSFVIAEALPGVPRARQRGAASF